MIVALGSKRIIPTLAFVPATRYVCVTDLYPGFETVTRYSPGGRFLMVKFPSPPVTELFENVLEAIATRAPRSAPLGATTTPEILPRRIGEADGAGVAIGTLTGIVAADDTGGGRLPKA
jgi:hypothetical protein